MGEESVYNISINTMKEMEKRGWIGYSQNKRLSLFIHSKSLLFDISHMISKVCITLIRSLCHASQLCACVLVNVHSISVVQNAKYKDHATRNLFVP